MVNKKKVAELNLDGGEKIILKPVTFDELLGIADNPLFNEKAVVLELLLARLDAKKKAELKRLFDPNKS